ncbi:MULTISPECIES: IS66 family insertion sequence element accessory protein TnpB [Pseudomonas syringae group]|uniref:Transposase n=1 Tax=Pseudomonas syringae pv. viburni TaxID=251703 RepID=A0A0Q0EEF3_9PSED|nr:MULTISPECIES: IS66 family insertion sequence element accessory protein TnpB [Pseudomonas syringae group]KPZ09579.1 Uncharacterized protein ALO40_02065 [Pseudomonas syringae pv. viburni]
MMRPDAKVEKVYLYPKPVDFRKSIDGLAALVELDIKVAVFDPVLADSTPSGHSAHQHPNTRSTLIRTGSRSAATQVRIVSLSALAD